MQPKPIRFPRFRKQPEVPAPAASWWDVWPPRINHISQFGLLISAVVAFFVTVVPLYQKALLEEAIARKEIELKDATKRLESTYKQVKGYVVGSLTTRLGRGCASTTLSIYMPAIGAPIKRIPRDVDVDTNLRRDFRACIASALKGTRDISMLTPVDQRALLDEVERIGEKAKRLQLTAIAEVETVRERAIKNPKILEPAYARIEKNKALSWKGSARPGFDDAVEETRVVITEKLIEEVEKEIRMLPAMSWPGTGPLEPRYRVPEEDFVGLRKSDGQKN